MRFWKDTQCREDPLTIAFLVLFSIATDKEALVDPLTEWLLESSVLKIDK